MPREIAKKPVSRVNGYGPQAHFSQREESIGAILTYATNRDPVRIKWLEKYDTGA